ncbi:hypothetical protein B0H14DRAFT_2648862 [Mycena olivaceomarginata]|nr:hypothetical protein B0H14DRAFT_2648862 [Mycena olivaceomarginata]
MHRTQPLRRAFLFSLLASVALYAQSDHPAEVQDARRYPATLSGRIWLHTLALGNASCHSMFSMIPSSVSNAQAWMQWGPSLTRTIPPPLEKENQTIMLWLDISPYRHIRDNGNTSQSKGCRSYRWSCGKEGQ